MIHYLTTFGVVGNNESENKLKAFVPAIAIIDYDGIYIHSAETFVDGTVKYITKPKKYFLHTFYIAVTTDAATGNKTYTVKSIENADFSTDIILVDHIYQVTFTMDDYIYLKIYKRDNISTIVANNTFYFKDELKNEEFISNIPSGEVLNADQIILKQNIIKYLDVQREKTISKVAMKEISYAINAHNEYAEKLGITYNFVLNPTSDEDWYETVNGIGMIAMVQGIPLGNRYLNYKGYGLTDLTLAKKYYLSNEIIKAPTTDTTYLSKKLYHSSDKCPIYEQYVIKYLNEAYLLKPKFFTSKNVAATNGYFPCPICKP